MKREMDTASGLARRLNVPRTRVVTWARRAHANNFPQPIARNDGTVVPLIPRKGRPGWLYPVNDVLSWYEWYRQQPVNSRGRVIGRSGQYDRRAS